ncbi:MAG TPA: leucine-rich repeat protein [Verrucomicrobiota bacterium]|nr:leucine-rich repeat protein [Verrucomicrobiota bacterium]
MKKTLSSAWPHFPRIVAGFIAAFLALVPSPKPAQGGQYGEFSYTLEGSAITITDFAGSGEMIIPDMIGGLPVTTLGDSAFSWHGSLTSVRIPGSVTTIESWAFFGCSGLFEIEIPDSVWFIGDGAFAGCNALTAITVDDSNLAYSSLDGVLFDFSQTKLIQCPAGKTGSYAIPASVKRIGYQAFRDCDRLTQITIPNGVTHIEMLAFTGCSGLTGIEIPQSLVYIEQEAFAVCPNLTTFTVDPLNTSFDSLDGVLFSRSRDTLVAYPNGKAGSYTIPSSVVSIKDWAFRDCNMLTSITIPNGVLSIGRYAFALCDRLASVVIPQSVTSIGDGAFSECANLTAITVDPLNSAYSSLDGVLFDRNRSLLMQCPGAKTGSYVVPNGVTGIEGGAFSSCTGLTDVTIPDSVESIGASAFRDCTGLVSATVGQSVASLDFYAFHNCPNLTSIYFRGDAPSLDEDVFGMDDNLTVYYLSGTLGWGSTFGGRPTAEWSSTTPPQIIQQPRDLACAPGTKATFTVTASGSLPLGYQWRKDGADLVGATNQSLALTNVRSVDFGNYDVIVSNSAGQATSQVARLSLAVNPVLAGQWPGYARGSASTVIVTNNIAYIAAESGGLIIMDVSDPAHPVRVGGCDTGADACDVAVSGNHAYVADWDGLQVIDVSDPANPVRVGGYYTSGWAEGVAVSGQYAYVADDEAGLQVIDVNDPANPVRVGGYYTSGSAHGVAVSGNYVYVADYDAGLQVIDVSDPANPIRVGGYDTSGYAYGVAVSGNYAYVADYDAGLQVIDVSDPTNPIRVGGYDTSGDAYGVAVSGNYAYVADCLSGLQVIDVSDPANPVRVGGYNTSEYAYGVAVSGNYAYVANGYDGLQAIDVSDPANPVRVSVYDTAGSAIGVAVLGNYAYVADVWAGLQVIDVSNPANPVRVGGYNTSGYAYGVAVSGNYAYVADAWAGLQVIDVSDPVHSVRVGGCDTSGSAYGVALSGNYAYVADHTAGLQVIDVSNPGNPVRVGGYDTSGWAEGVAVSGQYAYVADDEAGLQVIDVSDPAHPVRVGGYDTSGRAIGVAVSGQYAYVADVAGLQVINVNDPANPIRVGGCDTNMRADGVTVSGPYAYVADRDRDAGLQIIDVSDPANPVRVGGYDTAGLAYGVAVAANHILVADSEWGLAILGPLPLAAVAPQVIRQPENLTCNLGTNAVFTTLASGSLPLHYQWRKNAQPITGANNSILSLASVQPADSGDYDVIVSNSAGQSISSIASLTVLTPPAILQQPLSQTAAVGGAVQFQALASGDDPLAYQWRFEGAALPGATQPILSLTNLQLVQAGSYTVIVTNQAGSAMSQEAVLTILEQPSVQWESILPPGQIVNPGQTINLSALAQGALPLTYQWRLNGVNIPDATNSILVLSNVQPRDSGRYHVTVANPVGAVDIDPVEVVIGAPVLELADSFADASLAVAWTGAGAAGNTNATREPNEPQHAGKPGGRSVWMRWQAPGTGTMRLTTAGSSFDTLMAVYTGDTLAGLVPVASDEDSGGYLTSALAFRAVAGQAYQIAVDGFDGASGRILLEWQFELSVADVPEIRQNPRSQVAAPGRAVLLSVDALAQTALHYQWYFRDQPLPGTDQPELLIDPVVAAAVGPYWVEVRSASYTNRSAASVVELGPALGVTTEDKLGDLFGGAAGMVMAQAASARQPMGFVSVAAGVVGTQILENWGSTREVEEPNHGGIIGGASRWLRLEPETDGVLEVDTIGSEIDTVVAVYTGRQLSDLKLVASDDNGAPDGVRSRVRFPAAQGLAYLVAVDGPRDQSGRIHLNWRLGLPPGLAVAWPVEEVVRRGKPVQLAVTASGVPAPFYQWWRNGVMLKGETNAVLVLPGVYSGQAGKYRIEIWNFAGLLSSPEIVVAVAPDQPVAWGGFERLADGGLRLLLTGAWDRQYVIEISSDLKQWQPSSTNPPVKGVLEHYEPRPSDYERRYYRARVIE